MKEHYRLEEAIKKSYQVDPLKIDLSEAVANRVFMKKKAASVIYDRVLLIATCLIAIGTVIYCLSLVDKPSIPFILLFLIPAACFWGLSLKEYALLSKKAIKFQG